MRKLWICTWISFTAACICWNGWCSMLIGNELLWGAVAVYSSILTIDFLITSIVTTIRQTASPYRMFAVTNVIIGIGVVLFAVYSMTDEDAGYVGILLLMFMIPFLLFLLAADCVLYAIHHSKHP